MLPVASSILSGHGFVSILHTCISKSVFKCQICFLELVRSCFVVDNAMHNMVSYEGFVKSWKIQSWICCVNLLHTCLSMVLLGFWFVCWICVAPTWWRQWWQEAGQATGKIWSLLYSTQKHHWRLACWRHPGHQDRQSEKMAYLTFSLATVLPVTDVMYIMKHCFHLKSQFSARFACNNSASVDEVVPSCNVALLIFSQWITCAQLLDLTS